MEYRSIKGIGKKASVLVYGTPSACSGKDPGAAYDAFELAFSRGFTIFDTANAYGRSEENMGSWLEKSGRRDEVIILDKGCNPGMAGGGDVFSAETIRNQVALSLERLKTDYVDFYVLHRDDESKPVDEIVEVLNELKAEGKIRAFGGSNWSMKRLKETQTYAAAHGLEPFTVCSPSYSLAVLQSDPWGGSVTISGDDNEEFRSWLDGNRMPVFAYSAQARGYMSGKFRTDGDKKIEEVLWSGTIQEYNCPENLARLKRAETLAAQKGCSVSAISLAWLLHQPLNVYPIISSSGEKHIDEAVSSFGLHLTDEECQWLLNGER